MKIALDTNLLAYAEGINDDDKRRIVLDLIRRCPQETIVIPVQVLGELFSILVRKAGRSREDAREALLNWRDAFATIETSAEVMQQAFDLATDHRLSLWDAVILSAASQAGCRLLLSEDMQEGFIWGGVTIVNPFAAAQHILLDALLQGAKE